MIPTERNRAHPSQLEVLLKPSCCLVQAHTVSISQRCNCDPPRAVLWLEQFTDRPCEVTKIAGWQCGVFLLGPSMRTCPTPYIPSARWKIPSTPSPRGGDTLTCCTTNIIASVCGTISSAGAGVVGMLNAAVSCKLPSHRAFLVKIQSYQDCIQMPSR